MPRIAPQPNEVAPLAKSIRGRDRAKLDIQWEDPQEILTCGDQRLVRLITPKDCQQFGTLMHHCAGNWPEYIAKGIWHFLTVLTPDNVPHLTIHALDLEWRDEARIRKAIKEKEIDYGYIGYPDTYGLNPCPSIGTKVVPNRPVLINDRPCIVLSGYAKGYGQTDKYDETLKTWWDAFVVPDSKPIEHVHNTYIERYIEGVG